MPLSRSLPKIIGLPCSRTSIRSSRTSRSVKSRHAPSLKMLQFWRTSTNDEPLCRPARSSVSWRCSVWVSTERATNVASAARAIVSGMIGVSTVPDRRRLRLLAELGRRRRLALGQPVDPVVEHDQVDVDVAAHRVDDVVAADRQRVAVAGDDPDHEVRPGGLEPGRERRRPAVDRVEAVRVHVVRQPARAADARDEHDVLARRSRSRASPSGSGRGSSSRRSRGTSGPPGRTRSPCGSAAMTCGVLRAERRLGGMAAASWPLVSVMIVSSARTRSASVDDLGDPERLAADPVVADGVDEVARPDEHQQLAEVDLRDEHPAVAARGRPRCWPGTG